MLILFSAAIIILPSCGKKGCTDAQAKNYCEKCKKDDGSCTYEGKIIFWYNQTTANFLVNDGATSLNYYVDGQLIGSSSASVYYTSSPSCTSNGHASQTKDLGKSKSQSSSYSVKDQTSFEYWSGSVTFDATKECTTYQLQ